MIDCTITLENRLKAWLLLQIIDYRPRPVRGNIGNHLSFVVCSFYLSVKEGRFQLCMLSFIDSPVNDYNLHDKSNINYLYLSIIVK